MYQILIDGRDLYYPRDEEYTVSDAVVHLQLNDSGSVEFGLPVLNPEYGNIKNRISMLQVLKNGIPASRIDASFEKIPIMVSGEICAHRKNARENGAAAKMAIHSALFIRSYFFAP